MKRVLICAALAISATRASAQTSPAPQAVAIAKGDSVVLFITAPPTPYYGFVVHGLHQDTVQPERSPQQFASRIGSDLQTVLRATSTDNPLALMRRLDGDNFSANMLSVLFPAVGTALARTWREGGRAPGTPVDYRIEFLDSRGRTTESIPVHTTMTDVLPVAASALTAQAGETRVNLTWKYPPQRHDASDLVFGFNVYRAEGAAPATRVNQEIVLRDELKAPAFSDFDVHPGATYQYSVRALDLVGREGPPVSLTVVLHDTVPPAPAERVTTEVQKEHVNVVWPMAPETDAAGYFVERSTGLDKPYQRLNKTPIAVDQPSYTDTTALPGTQYFYRVVTIDKARNESIPSNPQGALPVDRTPPTAPADLQISLLPRHRAQLQWQPSRSNDVEGYFVFRREKNGAQVRVTSRPVQSPYIDAGPDSVGLPVGRTYEFELEAVDGANNESPRIGATLIVPDDQPPEPATALVVENVQGRYAIVRWSASPSGDVRQYQLQRTDAAGNNTPPVIVSRTATRMVRDTTVTLGSTYRYSLIAVDSAGNKSSAVADTFTLKDVVPPAPPRNAYARIAADGVHVGWERVPDADLAGYLVFRSDLPTGVFEQLNQHPVKELSFIDRNPKPDAYYVVRAIDTSENQSAPSPAVRAVPQ